jgi:hypothetical protein
MTPSSESRRGCTARRDELNIKQQTYLCCAGQRHFQKTEHARFNSLILCCAIYCSSQPTIALFGGHRKQQRWLLKVSKLHIQCGGLSSFWRPVDSIFHLIVREQRIYTYYLQAAMAVASLAWSGGRSDLLLPTWVLFSKLMTPLRYLIRCIDR